MEDFSKAEKKQLKALLKKGILRCHAEWLRELRELLDHLMTRKPTSSTAR